MTEVHVGMCVALRSARLWLPAACELDLRNLPLKALTLHV